LDNRIDAVLDGGATAVGLESTVAEVVDDGVIINRPGAVDPDAVESEAGIGWVRTYQPEPQQRAPQSLPSPGVGLRHYAPRARLLLVGGIAADALSRQRQPLELSLVTPIDQATDATSKVGVMLPDGWDASCAAVVYRWGDWNNGEMLAHRLFSGLRELDDAGATTIICPIPEMPGIGEAIRDRLAKAAMSKAGS
jgi:L-threonylcarbamoyladenylate synthase